MGDVRPSQAREYSTMLGLVGCGTMVIGTFLGMVFGSIVPSTDIFLLGCTLFFMGCLGVCWTFNLPDQEKEDVMPVGVESPTEKSRTCAK